MLEPKLLVRQRLLSHGLQTLDFYALKHLVKLLVIYVVVELFDLSAAHQLQSSDNVVQHAAPRNQYGGGCAGVEDLAEELEIALLLLLLLQLIIQHLAVDQAADFVLRVLQKLVYLLVRELRHVLVVVAQLAQLLLFDEFFVVRGEFDLAAGALVEVGDALLLDGLVLQKLR